MRPVLFFLGCWLVISPCISCVHTRHDKKNGSDTVNSGKDSTDFPKAEHYVNDFDDILTTGEENRLNEICATYDKKTTNQIVVATFKTFAPYSKMENFCTDLFNAWKIGTAEKDNGLLIVVFRDLHKARITTGYGTEKILTNQVCDTIMNQYMIPHFKEGEYYNGLKSAVEESIKRWN